ncbi:SDR family NAD(P)-dependent oxidoreductase [Sulfidibacter corallicola]|uniref:SDR family NAD(P)-dependent oxidoreductase n=1 Tax=Sulfidibacter corallicola TaxID=2818388 RepID=A0A8A4TLT3_SULCO|nr:SDR family NAD(P)-dependent oxidoreductase [Sulfidibacter corallicola]QTD50520.1 SDR family NAD(P)-dependent oxidoreductase [Sulfidibacter corallicola]
MSEPRKRILARIQAGELSPEEGLALLRQADSEPMVPSGTDAPRALIIEKPGDIDDVQVRAAEPSSLGPDQVRIAVRAFSLNFGDWLCVRGLYPTMPDYPFTPGFEVAGTVLACGDRVTECRPGDAVIALMGSNMGGHAEEVVANASHVVPKPDKLDFAEACALPVVFLTAWYALERAGLRSGERILIQTAAGGTGLMAVQLAHLRGATVIGTVGSPAKADYLRNLGVAHAIDYERTDFATEVARLTAGQGVDVVLNTLAGDAIQKGLNLLAPEGRYVEIAMTGLKSSRPLDLSHLVENQSLISIDLRRLGLKRPELLREGFGEMVRLVTSGQVRATIAKRFPFERVHEAYRFLQRRANIGKVVVTVAPRPVVSRPVSITANDFGRSPESTNPVRSEKIAIIGLAGRFPDADDIHRFWENLVSGRDSVRDVPRHRWNVAEVFDPKPGQPGKTYCKWGGFLERVDQFDPLFFNMSGREAELADPQQRLFLETCWQALEDAAYSDARLATSSCGVFVGAGSGDYLQRMADAGLAPEAQTFIGNAASILAARIAYFLNLKGPSIAVDTACSSSLVALHLACRSLVAGECKLALAGGVFLMNSAQFHLLSARSEMLSPDGRCKAFDDEANGFVPGEGVGAVLLKPLATALADGDPIHAVIDATAVNQDGRTNGITAPSSLSQTELELTAWRKAGISPADLSYIETHGTGTSLGDPIEIDALTRAFREAGDDERQRCAIGSVKTNIGHLAMAAGIAGLIKVVMALRHRTLPPSLHFHKPNRYIDFKASPFFVNTEARPWREPSGKPLRAALSSFGFSGTNCHVVLSEPPPTAPAPSPDHRAYLFTFSAQTERALGARIAAIATWLESNPSVDLWRLAFTLNFGRSDLAQRAAIIASDHDELHAALRAFPMEGAATGPAADPERDRELNDVLDRLATGYERAWLERAAELYRAGAQPEWHRLYRGRSYGAYHLPGYDFERDSHWVFDEDPFPDPAVIPDDLAMVPRWTRAPAKANASGSAHADRFDQGDIWLCYPAEARDLARGLANHFSAGDPGRTLISMVLDGEPVGDERMAPVADEAACNAWAAEVPLPARVFWFAGASNPLAASNPIAALQQAEASGVLAAQSLFRAMAPRAWNHAFSFTLITQNATAPDGGRIHPGYAALLGWAKCLGREFTKARVALLDVDARDRHRGDLAATIADEPGALPLEVALRDGTRWIRRAARVAGLRVPDRPPWRHGGTFVIAGGAGGIGYALSLHLARTVEARLCWLGRREEDDDLRERMAAVRSAGGEVLYCRADITDEAETNAAFDRCRRTFGAIHGVIHSAIAMDDGLIEALDRDRFRKALVPKTLGSLHLLRAAENDQLDFAMFFSSFNAWTGNRGQANYSAGCTFKDAFAEAAARQYDIPVHIVDWGFWGEVGIVATPQYRKRLAAAGVLPITTEEAIRTLEAIVAAGLPHAMVIRANEAVAPLLAEESLSMSLADRTTAPTAPHFAVHPAEVLSRAVAATADRLPVPAEAEADRLEAFCALRLLVKIREMGFADRVGERVTEEHLAQHWHLAPKMVPLLGALLDILADRGWIAREDDGWCVLPAVAEPDLLSRIDDWQGERDRFAAAVPAMEPHLALLEAGVADLDRILSGALPATETLFPGGSAHLVEAIYKGNAHADFHNSLCAETIERFLAAQRQAAPGSVPRILEVGAGTGGTTRAVVSAVEGKGPLRYLYTDVSAGFTRLGHERFADRDFMSFAEFDLERDPVAQGLVPASFDVVLAANVVHATADVHASLTRLARLLRPGGWLILYEVVAATHFNTLTFGLLDGWWQSRDSGLRLPHTPLLDPQRWRLALTAAGYLEPSIGGLPERPESAWRQAVVVAKAGPLRPEATDQPEAAPALPAVIAQTQKETATLAAPASISIGPPPATGDADQVAHILRLTKRRLRHLLAGTLKVDEARIGADRPFQELGVDSLIAVELAQVIETEFGVSLRTTDLFNYGNLEQLATHLAAHGPKEEAPQSPPRHDTAQTPPSVRETAPPVAQRAAGASETVAAPMRDEPIAIVGMSARFADRDDCTALWAMLREGRHAIGSLPAKRWSHTANDYQGAFIPDLDHFDPLFFGISPLEARYMDPQQRICLEEVWRVFEDAGLDVTRLADRQVGVYVGASGNSYLHGIENSLGAIGNSIAALSGRISYLLDLRGPNLAVDTACSSSLVAIHLAAQALRRGECHSAVVAGVSALMTSPDMFLFFEDSGMASPTARCRTFDQGADGFVPGEGVAALLLEPLSAAVADGHRIYGVVRASAVNQDGRTNGITAPSAPSQAELLRRVYAEGGIDPATIDYVEAHGTGTRLGDPIEVQALTEAFGTGHDRPCPIGSVKTNLGHTLAAAGIAGVVKVLLALQHEQLPPSLHFERENPHIQFERTPFRVCDRLTPWPAGPRPRRAAVSSFGFSGTNCHLVLEEGPSGEPVQPPTRLGPHLFVLSAKSAWSLERRARDLLAWLETNPHTEPSHLSATLALGRAVMPIRHAWVAADAASLRTAMNASLTHGDLGQAEELSATTLDLLAAQVEPTLEALAAGTHSNQVVTAHLAERHLTTLADLFQRGVDIDWTRLYPAGPGKRLGLPTYPFERDSFWLEDRVRFGASAGSTAPTPAIATEHGQDEDWDRIVAAMRATGRAESASFDAGGTQAFRELGRLLLWDALRAANRFTAPDQRASQAEMAAEWGVLEKYDRLFRAVLHLLADADFVTTTDQWITAPSQARWDQIETGRTRLPEMRRAFGERYPDLQPYVTLLETCVAHLPRVIDGRVQATDVLFPKGDLGLVEGIYRGNRIMDFYNRLLASGVAAMTEATLNRLPPGEKVWILEAGAGTGGSSAFVLEALRPWADRVVYYYTDLSLGFLQHAKERFVPDYPFMVPHLFDVEKDPVAQDLPRGRFHIAFATNALHATRDMRRTLSHIGEILAPGAWMLVNELTRVQDFGTLTFGLLDGWWLYEDEALRLPDSPLLGLREWSSLFAASGFERVEAFGRPDEPAEEAVQHVVVARRTFEAVTPAAGIDMHETVDAQTPRNEDTLPAEPAGNASPGTPNGDLLGSLRAIVAEVLELPPARIAPTTPYQDIGVDSIMAVKVVERIGTKLGIALESTDLFNYPNLRQLARHIGSRQPQPKPLTEPSSVATTPPASPLDATDTNGLGDVLARLKSGDLKAGDLLAQRGAKRLGS